MADIGTAIATVISARRSPRPPLGLGKILVFAGAQQQARTEFARADKEQVFVHQPPPTAITISSRSPPVSSVEACRLFGTISPLRSTAMRLPAVSSCASSCAMVVACGSWRVCPFTATEIDVGSFCQHTAWAVWVSNPRLDWEPVLPLNDTRTNRNYIRVMGCERFVSANRSSRKQGRGTTVLRRRCPATCSQPVARRTHVLSLGSSGPAIERHPRAKNRVKTEFTSGFARTQKAVSNRAEHRLSFRLRATARNRGRSG